MFAHIFESFAMPDFAISEHKAVQEQLDRLSALSPGRDILGLERIRDLCALLDNPQDKMPPVFHIAGTNGKGSVTAFLRNALEASGHKVHVYSSPHLVRFNERIRVAGRLIDDDYLAKILALVLDKAETMAAAGNGPSFFEVTTAAAFYAFADIPAHATILEVGLGGRLDATNIITAPVVTAIAALGVDHEGFLLSDEAGCEGWPALERIAWEKAGIAKKNAPLVTQKYPANMAARIASHAKKTGAIFYPRGDKWDAQLGEGDKGAIYYHDEQGKISCPAPHLSGGHQRDNLALAMAILRHQDALNIAPDAFAQASQRTFWPARLQKLSDKGALAQANRYKSAIWLDGGHNAIAGQVLANFLAEQCANGEKFHLMCGMLSNKDPKGLVAPLLPYLHSITILPVPGHDHHDDAAFRAALADDLAALNGEKPQFCTPQDTAMAALSHLPAPKAPVLIAGSLYLAGEILRDNGEYPQ